MRKIVAGLHMTLDGVIEAPDKWSFAYFNEEIGKSIQARIDATDTLLFGRQGYQEFAAVWPGRDGAIADFMNNTPKLVASTTLTQVTWSNSTLIKGDLIEALTTLKQQPGRNITVSGSATLVRFLVQAGALDELHLTVCPIVLGTGKRLFERMDGEVPLKLAASESFQTGVVHLTYQPA